MTLRQIIEQLRKEGHIIEYVENKPPKSKATGKRPKSGQIRITRIDNKTYKVNMSVGNAKARELSGEKLSARKQAQLQQARANIKPKTSRVSDLPQDIERDLKRVQAKIRKSEKRKAQLEGKDEVEKSKSTLRIKKKTIRKKLKEEGYQATKDALKKLERYWEGYANESSIQAVSEILNRAYTLTTDTDERAKLLEAIKIFDEIKYRISEDALEEILAILYDFQKGSLKAESVLKILETKQTQTGKIIR